MREKKREKERDRERDTEKERDGKRDNERIMACIHIHIFICIYIFKHFDPRDIYRFVHARIQHIHVEYLQHRVLTSSLLIG